MSTTPDVTDTRVLIDWSNATSTDVAATRGNGVLFVANTVKELIIIGNPDLTYTNFSISLVDFAANQELVLCLDNFKFTTNVDGAIKTNGTDNGMILTIDVHGTCSINTSVAGGSIIKGLTNTLNFTGDGQITITAGTGSKGGKGSTPGRSDTGNGGTGGAGQAGGVAISATTVVFSDKLIAEIIGGTGGTGGTGGNSVNKYVGSKNSGGTGGIGGNGGNAIVANTLTISSTAKVSVYGGDGGNGGNGGYRDTRYSNGSLGSGGTGGSGAFAISASTIINGSLYYIKNGSNGSSGSTGGNWHSQDDYYNSSYWN